MYILAQDKSTIINFDNFHEIFCDGKCIFARQFSDGKKINVLLGKYSEEEIAMREFRSILGLLYSSDVIAIEVN